MKIILPLPPNLANSKFKHWAAKKQAKDAYVRTVVAVSQNAKMHTLTPWFVVPRYQYPVTVKYHFGLWNKSDEDNLIARGKWALDAIVTNGILIDDSPDYVQIARPTQEIDRKWQRLEVEIT